VSSIHRTKEQKRDIIRRHAKLDNVKGARLLFFSASARDQFAAAADSIDFQKLCHNAFARDRHSLPSGAGRYIDSFSRSSNDLASLRSSVSKPSVNQL
jgi:hypothetical protein